MKLRITALLDIRRKYSVVCAGVKVAVALSRNSGAKVAYGTRMISGTIGSGGSRANWYCSVSEGSVFEIDVDDVAYRRNKGRFTNWAVEEIQEFSMSEEESRLLVYEAANNRVFHMPPR